MIAPLDIAIAHLGIKEATGNNDGLPADLYSDGEKIAWCAAAVLYWFRASDYPELPGNRWLNRRVETLERNCQKAEIWLPRASVPQPNDVIFYATRGTSDAAPGGRHVGLVERIEGDWIHTIEGNISNKVGRRKEHRNSKRITGFARLTPPEGGE